MSKWHITVFSEAFTANNTALPSAEVSTAGEDKIKELVMQVANTCTSSKVYKLLVYVTLVSIPVTNYHCMYL